MLHAPTSRRERILLFGLEDGGKSTTWLQIAQWLHRTGSPARVYAMDSDMVANWAPDVYPNFDHNVTAYDTYKWEEYKEALSKAESDYDPARGDWLVVDTGDRPWAAVQDWYTRVIKEVEVENWVIEHAKSDKFKQHPLTGEYGMNWFYINDQYNRWFQPIIRWRGHVLVCCHEKPLARASGEKGERPDDKELIQLYDKVGVRPEGQKGLSLPMQTVIRLSNNIARVGSGKIERKLTTVKDKGRDVMQDKAWGDFVVDYLVDVAKWEM